MSDLPVDIVHSVCEALRGDIIHDYPDARALSACTLICKAWHEVARPYLFASVFVRALPRGIEFLDFFAFVEEHPHLARYIRRLSLELDDDAVYRIRNAYGEDREFGFDDPEKFGEDAEYRGNAAMLDFPAFLDTLPRLTSLRALAFFSLAARNHDIRQRGRPPNAVTSSLQQLIVSGRLFPIDILFSGLLVQRIGLVRFHDINVWYHDWDDSTIARVDVLQLELDAPDPAAPPLLDFYTKLISPKSMRTLTITCSGRQSTERSCALVRVVGTGLEHITFDFGEYFERCEPGSLSGPPMLVPDWAVVGGALASCRALKLEITLAVYDPDILSPQLAVHSDFLTIMDITPLLTILASHSSPRHLTCRLQSTYDHIERLDYDSSIFADFPPDIEGDLVLDDLRRIDDVCARLASVGDSSLSGITIMVDDLSPKRSRRRRNRDCMVQTRLVQEGFPKLREIWTVQAETTPIAVGVTLTRPS